MSTLEEEARAVENFSLFELDKMGRLGRNDLLNEIDARRADPPVWYEMENLLVRCSCSVKDHDDTNYRVAQALNEGKSITEILLEQSGLHNSSGEDDEPELNQYQQSPPTEDTLAPFDKWLAARYDHWFRQYMATPSGSEEEAHARELASLHNNEISDNFAGQAARTATKVVTSTTTMYNGDGLDKVREEDFEEDPLSVLLDLKRQIEEQVDSFEEWLKAEIDRTSEYEYSNARDWRFAELNIVLNEYQRRRFEVSRLTTQFVITTTIEVDHDGRGNVPEDAVNTSVKAREKMRQQRMRRQGPDLSGMTEMPEELRGMVEELIGGLRAQGAEVHVRGPIRMRM